MKNRCVRNDRDAGGGPLGDDQGFACAGALDVNIPFAFTAGSKALGASEYGVQKVKDALRRCFFNLPTRANVAPCGSVSLRDFDGPKSEAWD